MYIFFNLAVGLHQNETATVVDTGKALLASYQEHLIIKACLIGLEFSIEFRSLVSLEFDVLFGGSHRFCKVIEVAVPNLQTTVYMY